MMSNKFLKTTIMHFCAFETLFIISVLVSHAFSLQHISNHPGDHSKNSSVFVAEQAKENMASIEIIIVCDMEFGVSFDFNRTKILHYWQADFRDVHSRFQSLRLSSISFRVASIIVLEKTEEQPFMEDVRNQDGSVSLDPLVISFGKWLLSQKRVIKNYDMAILATGILPGDMFTGIANFSSICAANIADGSVPYSILATRLPVPCAPLTLAHEIAHVLGAPHDEEKPLPMRRNHPINAASNFIMSDNIKEAHAFFSIKTDVIIEKFLETDQARSCTKNLISPDEPIIDTAKMADEPFSASSGIPISDQCKIIMNDSSAYSVPGVSSCKLSLCLSTYSLLDLITKGISREWILPFAFSPCAENRGYCYRGECIRQGVHLVNSASGTCVASTDSFSSDARPLMMNCSRALSETLDSFHLDEVDSSAMLLSMFYYDVLEPESTSKCLTLGTLQDLERSKLVTFEKCNATATNMFGWAFVWLEENGDVDMGEFLLKHRGTGLCASVVANATMAYVVATECADTVASMKWKFIKQDGAVMNHGNMHEIVKRNSWFSMEEFLFLLWAFYVVVLPFCLVVLAWKACKATRKLIAKLYLLARSI